MKLISLLTLFIINIFSVIDGFSQEVLFNVNTINSDGDRVKIVGFLNNKILFSANDGMNGNELWQYDIVKNEYYLVDDIYPGPESSNPNIGVVLNDRFYFSATTVNGVELCYYDGINVIKYDLYPGIKSSNPQFLTVFDNRVVMYLNNRDASIFEDRDEVVAINQNGVLENVYSFADNTIDKLYHTNKDNSVNAISATNEYLYINVADFYFSKISGTECFCYHYKSLIITKNLNKSELFPTSRSRNKWYSYTDVHSNDSLLIFNRTIEEFDSYILINNDKGIINSGNYYFISNQNVGFVTENNILYEIKEYSLDLMNKSKILSLNKNKPKNIDIYNLYKYQEDIYIYANGYLSINGKNIDYTDGKMFVVYKDNIFYSSNGKMKMFELPKIQLMTQSGDKKNLTNWKISNNDSDVKAINIFFSKDRVNFTQLAKEIDSIYTGSFIHKNIYNDSSYYYYVSFDTDFSSDIYSSDTLLAIPRDLSPPISPYNLNVHQKIISGKILLEWSHDMISDVSRFLIYKSKHSDFRDFEINQTDTNATNYYDNILHRENSFFYKISAIDYYKNESQFSNVDSVSFKLSAIEISKTRASIDSLVQVPIIFRGNTDSLGGLQFATKYYPEHLSNSTTVPQSGNSKLISGKLDVSSITFNQIDTTLYFSWSGEHILVSDGDTLLSLQFRVGSQAPVFKPLEISGSDALEAIFVNEIGEEIVTIIESGSVMVTPFVTGTVFYGYDSTTPIAGTTVFISDTTRTEVYSSITATNGLYRHLMPVRTVKLTASKQPTTTDKDALTITDILLIQRHIVKLDSLSIYKLFLADVNQNGKINVQDAVFLHRLVAGLDEELPKGLWQIMPSQQKALLPLTNYEKRFTIQDGDTSDVNFHAHLMGDINGSWASLQKEAKSVAHPLVQWAQDKEETVIMVENQSFLEFSLSDIQESVYGYQLELIFPNDVQVSIASQPEGSFLSSQKVYDTQHTLLKMVWYNLEQGLEESLPLIQFQIESSRSEFPIQLARKTTFVNLKGEPVQARLAISYNGEEQTLTSTETSTLPSKTELKETYPNPFNPSTTIRYRLAKSEKVSLSVYSVLGQLVAEIPIGLKPAGEHTFLLKGDQWSSGIYLLNLKAGSYQATKRITLIK